MEHSSRRRRSAPYSGGTPGARPKFRSSSSRFSGGSRSPYSSSNGNRRRFDRNGGSSARHGSGRSSFSRGRGRARASFDVSQYINKNPVKLETETAYQSTHTFADFGFKKIVVDAVARAGLTNPTPIQDEIIPHIVKKQDVVGLANTGTGKTAAFLLPLIDRALTDDKSEVLILTPTRELAQQIEQELRKLSDGMRLFSTTCVGGTNMYQQISRLKRKNHFVIGTPGRILDLIERRVINPTYFTTVVLDEADRMLDMGFIKPITDILENTPKTRNTLFFSATMSSDIERLVGTFLRDPKTVSVKKKDITNAIEQDVVRYEHHNKFETLLALLAQPEFTRVIIFGSMKHSVEKLSQELNARGIAAESIHGNKSQNQRQRSLSRFKSGNARVLVATDVAARGIHVDQVSHVINYDLPGTYEDYVHRIGRTGRGIHLGKALTFVH